MDWSALSPDEQSEVIRLEASLVSAHYRDVSRGRSTAMVSRLLRQLRELAHIPYETERSLALMCGRVPPSREAFSPRRA